MTTVLVAVAGRHGATVGIAEEIAGVLRAELPGAEVEVRDAADPGDLHRFDAVLVGSAIYMGRPGTSSRNTGRSSRPSRCGCSPAARSVTRPAPSTSWPR
jgi:Flavodoxin domain